MQLVLPPSTKHAVFNQENGTLPTPPCTGSSKRKGAKFGEESSARADWQCIGCPNIVGRRKAEYSNREHFFGTSLYIFFVSAVKRF